MKTSDSKDKSFHFLSNRIIVLLRDLYITIRSIRYIHIFPPVFPGQRGRGEHLGVFGERELLLPLRPLHRQRQLHARRRLQPRGPAGGDAHAGQVLAYFPQEQDSAGGTTR